MADDHRPYDLAVIGAGLNGAGIARDAALRGLRVIIIEQYDLCTATSAWASRLIHGGLRYLEYGEIGLVHESLRERITLRRIAAHLVQPLRICIPIYEGARRGPLLIRLGMIAYDMLSVGKTVPHHDMLSRKEMLAEEPGVLSDGLRAAARYYDAQIRFTERLVLENLIGARAAGAEIRTYCRVTAINVDDGAVQSVGFTDTLTGQRHDIEASVVVNAGGPWVDEVLATAPGESPQLVGGTKGSHIVVSAFAGAPRDAFYVEAAADGRPFFIIPWNRLYLIGTTDLRFEGDIATLRASREEVDYLLNETNRVFPDAKLTTADIHYAYTGVRPLPYQEKGPESAITRRHIIKENRQIAAGLISIIGGKLTTYRNLAEQTIDRVGKLLGRKLPDCRTHDTLLPGAYRLDEARNALEALDALAQPGVERLLAIYGGRASAIVELAGSESALDRTIDANRTVLAAEVVFAIREEMVRTLTDIVFRRMMLGFGANQGRDLYVAVADLAADELRWSMDEREAQLADLTAYSDSFVVKY